jgi:hypothetical protein
LSFAASRRQLDLLSISRYQYRYQHAPIGHFQARFDAPSFMYRASLSLATYHYERDGDGQRYA